MHDRAGARMANVTVIHKETVLGFVRRHGAVTTAEICQRFRMTTFQAENKLKQLELLGAVLRSNRERDVRKVSWVAPDYG